MSTDAYPEYRVEFPRRTEPVVYVVNITFFNSENAQRVTEGGDSELISPDTTVRELASVGDVGFLVTLIGSERGNGAARSPRLHDGLLAGETSPFRCEACN